jgi:hypothetical protein
MPRKTQEFGKERHRDSPENCRCKKGDSQPNPLVLRKPRNKAHATRGRSALNVIMVLTQSILSVQGSLPPETARRVAYRDPLSTRRRSRRSSPLPCCLSSRRYGKERNHVSRSESTSSGRNPAFRNPSGQNSIIITSPGFDARVLAFPGRHSFGPLDIHLHEIDRCQGTGTVGETISTGTLG